MKKHITEFIQKYSLQTMDDLISTIKQYGKQLNSELVCNAAEMLNPNKNDTAAFYTDKMICEEIVKELPKFETKNKLRIFEPAVGGGVFLPFVAEKYKDKQKLEIWINDIDEKQLEISKLIFKTYYQDKYPNVEIKLLNKDYLKFDELNENFDLIIGNPPYQKIKPINDDYKIYKKQSKIKKSTNLFVYFFEKALKEADIISFIVPKSILNAPEYIEIRNILNKFLIKSIIDFGEKGFDGVKIETVNIVVDITSAPKITNVKSITHKIELNQKQSYITDENFPTWLIYRNEEFDKFSEKLELGIFSTFRDRQITSKNCKDSGKIRVLRSRNIQTNNILNIQRYDMYLDEIDNLVVAKYLNKENIICLPNLSYSPRACFLPKNCIADGSVALLESDLKLDEKDLEIFETNEFRNYYRIARNYGTRSLNIDKNSIFYFGVRKNDVNKDN